MTEAFSASSFDQVIFIRLGNGEYVPVSAQYPMPVYLSTSGEGAPKSIKMMDKDKDKTDYELDVSQNNTVVIRIEGSANAEVTFWAKLGSDTPFELPGNKINELYVPSMNGAAGDVFSFAVSMLDAFLIRSTEPVDVYGKVL